MDRPWAEWMGSSHFQLGPLHLCDYLLRAELGISGIALEIAPGYSAPGSHIRDLFEFSKLLDLYSLLNVPLHLWMVMPSADGPDPHAEPGIRVETAAVARPAGRGDAGELGAHGGSPWPSPSRSSAPSPGSRPATPCPHIYPHGGLIRADQAAKPLVAWLQSVRAETLA